MEKDKEAAYLVRLNEINAMVKITISHADKKALRKEVRAIKSELALSNGGVFFSGINYYYYFIVDFIAFSWAHLDIHLASDSGRRSIRM